MVFSILLSGVSHISATKKQHLILAIGKINDPNRPIK